MKNTSRNRNLRGGMKNAVAFALALGVTMSLPMTAMAEEYDISQGSIKVEARNDGQYVTQENSNDAQGHKETTDTVIKQNESESTSNTITITAEKDQTAEVTLSGVNITTAFGQEAPVKITGDGSVSIELDGDNTLNSNNGWHAGLEKDENGTLSINDNNDNSGSLVARSANYGAGIGGAASQSTSNIEINGGTITAVGGGSGAGIGGGGRINSTRSKGDGRNIAINGGKVSATSNSGGAGIGGGGGPSQGGDGTGIIISGGEVTATGNNGGAGIGGGANGGNGSDIAISGGEVHATGNDGGAGIGGGSPGGKGSNVTISGDAKVTAQASGDSNFTGAAIGGGAYKVDNKNYNGSELQEGEGLYTSELLTTGFVKKNDGEAVSGTVTPPQPEQPTENPQTASPAEPGSRPENPSSDVPVTEPAAEPSLEDPSESPIVNQEETEVVESVVTGTVPNTSDAAAPVEAAPVTAAVSPVAEHYQVRIANAVNGAVALDRENALPGETVIVMAAAFDGYVLKGITVVCDNGQIVPVIEFGNGVFTFVMPQGHVTVSAEFVPATATELQF